MDIGADPQRVRITKWQTDWTASSVEGVYMTKVGRTREPILDTSMP